MGQKRTVASKSLSVGGQTVRKGKTMANIRFVRAYEFYGNSYYDVIYGRPGQPCRVYTYSKEDLPKTVSKWLEGKEGETQRNGVFNRDETVYKAEIKYRVEYDFYAGDKDVHAYLDNNGKGFCHEDAVYIGKQLVAQGNRHISIIAI